MVTQQYSLILQSPPIITVVVFILKALKLHVHLFYISIVHAFCEISAVAPIFQNLCNIAKIVCMCILSYTYIILYVVLVDIFYP